MRELVILNIHLLPLESAPYIIPGSYGVFIKIIVKLNHAKEHHKIWKQ
jgi:hypothetical protein